MKNRVWINAGDLVVACPQEDITAKDKADIVHKFYPEEAFELQDLGEIPANVTINEGAVDEEADDDLNMGDADSDGGEEGKNDDLDIDDI